MVAILEKLVCSGDFTIEAWVNPDATNNTRTIVSKWAAGQKSYRLDIRSNKLVLVLSTDGAAESTVTGASDIPTGEWTHVAAVRDGDDITLYINETSDATDTFTGSVYDGSAALQFGQADSSDLFDGLLDEVRISSAARAGDFHSVSVSYAYNERNQLVTETSGTSVKTYAYDPNGNTLGIVEQVGAVEVSASSMAYDALNRQIFHGSPAGVESMGYRGAEWHRDTLRSSNSPETAFLYDGNNVLADLTDGSISKFYVTPFLDQNLSMTVVGGPQAGIYYYSQDGLGSVRTLTDSAGDLANHYDHDAFGVPLPTTTSELVEQRYTYTGRESSGVNGGPMYNRYRMNFNGLGRFGRRDPAGYWNNIYGNLYPYVENNPGNYDDSYGLGGWEDTGVTSCCPVKGVSGTTPAIITTKSENYSEVRTAAKPACKGYCARNLYEQSSLARWGEITQSVKGARLKDSWKLIEKSKTLHWKKTIMDRGIYFYQIRTYLVSDVYEYSSVWRITCYCKCKSDWVSKIYAYVDVSYKEERHENTRLISEQDPPKPWIDMTTHM